VKIVALRITVVFDGNGVYVLGKGSAFGTDNAPSPGAGLGVVSVGVAGLDAVVDADVGCAGVGDVAGFGGEQPSATNGTTNLTRRIALRDLRECVRMRAARKVDTPYRAR
jgi:hypothetical protein